MRETERGRANVTMTLAMTHELLLHIYHTQLFYTIFVFTFFNYHLSQSVTIMEPIKTTS